jgi:kumamolisin
MDLLFKEAALLGITICVATGDHGTNDVAAGDDPGAIHVDYPAASDLVLACGGTMIAGDREVVWNDGDDDGATGGGISVKYPRPAWQDSVNSQPSLATGQPGRGVPDVAASATNYHIVVDGFAMTMGGTSAVAPLWAALVARINQSLGRRVGFINPAIYVARDAFVDITAGSNTAHGLPGYRATSGWDACTGLGTPIGDVLVGVL